MAVAKIREIRSMHVNHEPVHQLLLSQGTKKVNLNLSPYRDMSPTKKYSRRSTGPATMILNNKALPANDPTNFYWLYGSMEYPIGEAMEIASKKVKRQIERLVEKMRQRGDPAKGSLLFDIIATRKHIEEGNPHTLGKLIYRFVEEKYFDDITTTFVGLTDNTARRVARDVFCRNKELSKPKHDFDAIDDIHMFIIYPPVEHTMRDPINSTHGFSAHSHMHLANPNNPTDRGFHTRQSAQALGSGPLPPSESMDPMKPKPPAGERGKSGTMAPRNRSQPLPPATARFPGPP